jgi:hypothetical protein
MISRRPPELFFAVELLPEPLQALFEQPGLFEQLQRLNAGICLAVMDFSPQRLEVVQRLNAAGIPVNAWLLLPQAQGYWLNLDNAAAASSRYAQFIAWTRQNNLDWEAIGLDIEPDIHLFDQILSRPWNAVPRIARNLLSTTRLATAQRYHALAAQIRADGYEVETYQFPFIIDERLAHSTFLQRALGLVDLPADREILMLYSSFLRWAGPGLLWSYAYQAGCVGVGSTGGGVSVNNLDRIPPLTWPELEQDMFLAYQVADRIFIFSLEGCIAQGYLDFIEQIDWSRHSIPLPVAAARRVGYYRRAGQLFLSAMSRPVLFLLSVLFGWVFMRRAFQILRRQV